MADNLVVTVDNGNTHPHFAIFENEKRKHILDHQNFYRQYPSKEWKKFRFVVSSVGQDIEFFNILKSLNIHAKTVKDFRKADKIGKMHIDYSDTIGDDRLIQAYYLHHLHPSPQILIDAGTFITIDIINEKGLVGGYIFPGVRPMLASFLSGRNLPHLREDMLELDHKDIPHDTQSAMSSAVVLYLKNMVDYFSSEFSRYKFVLTGGDAHYFEQIFSEKNISGWQVDHHLIHNALFCALKELGEMK